MTRTLTSISGDSSRLNCNYEADLFSALSEEQLYIPMEKNQNHAMKVIFAILVSAVCLSLCDETNAQNRANGHDDERY